MVSFFPSKILFSFGLLWCMLFFVIKAEERENSLSACEIERLLKPILSPPDERTIQAQALRQRLISLIRQGFREQLDNNGIEEKPSAWDDQPEKRNLQALARDGYIKTLPEGEENEENDSSYKRGLQILPRNDQFPPEQEFPSNPELKRGIESLARNGELHHTRQDLEDLLEELYEKRNIGSLARDFNFPNYGKRFLGSLARSGDLNRYEMGKRNLASIVRNGKRNLASLVRNNNLPAGYDEYKRNIASLARDGGKFMGKRNAAALLRQDNYLNEKNHSSDEENARPVGTSENGNDESGAADKRNLASIKAGSSRNKRQAEFYDFPNEEYPQPVYQNQNNNVDYEDLVNALTAAYPNNQKRFLGRLPQMGKPKTTPIPKVRRRRISGFY